jgi:hypothetical protein
MACGKFTVGKGNVLLPMDDGAKEIAKVVGTTVEVEVMYDRDMVYHRRVFATMRELAQAIGQSPEWMRAQLLTYCGLFNIVGTLDGRHVIAISSMSRHSMRDEELHHFWDDSKEHIVKRVLPLITNDTVRDRLHTSVTAF